MLFGIIPMALSALIIVCTLAKRSAERRAIAAAQAAAERAAQEKARAATDARRAAASAAELFAVYVPGRGSAGFYPTFKQAEKARLALSCTSRQRAIIYDADGNALYR